MEKFTRDIIFKGINNKIKETLNELGYTNIEYLDDFCIENDFELIITQGSHEETCSVGWDDAETSENISDALLYLYECNFTSDNNLIYDIYISNDTEKTFVTVLNVKDYTDLVIVDRYGNEANPYSSEFMNAIVEKVDESLNNYNLQDTVIYKSIFTQEDIDDDDEKYNINYDLLIDRIVKSVKNYMLEETGRRFDVDASTHYVSCYYFFEVPTVRDYYIDDITDILL